MKTLKQLKESRSFLFIMMAVVLALLSITLLSSCHKREGTPVLDALDHQTTNDETAADSEFDDILKTAEEAVDSVINSVEFPVTISVGPCAVVTADTANHDITIDFGTGCEGYDGRVRSGKIEVHYIGYYRNPGSQLTVTLDNFIVDDITVSGTLTYIAVHRDENNHLTMTTNVKNGKLTYNETGRYISWETSKSLTWVSGENTGDVFDDVYEVTGYSNGVSTAGISFTTDITSPITTKTACWNQNIFYPVSGVKEVKPAGFPARVVDFGDGTCDKVVTITVNHDTYTVTLP